MSLIISIVMYTFFALVLYSLGRNEWLYTQRRYRATGYYSQKWTNNIFLLLFFFIGFSSIRYQVGVDCESYATIYKDWHHSVFSDVRYEPGFVVLLNLLKSIGAGRIIFLGSLAALEIVPFYYALRSRKFLYPYIGLLLMLGPFYLIWMNGIRQSIAACLFVLATVIIIDGGKKKRLFAALLIILAAQFHSTAYALLVFVFLPVWDIFRSRIVNLGILVFCLVAGMFGSVANSFLSNFIGLNVEGDAYLLHYVNGIEAILGEESTMGFGPRRLIILFLSVIAIWYEPLMKEYYKDDKFFIFSFNMFFIHVCLCENLFTNVSLLFRRPFYYTYPFEMILFAYLLYFMKYINKGKNKQTMYLVTIGLACIYTIVLCILDSSLPDEASLYKVIFFTNNI